MLRLDLTADVAKATEYFSFIARRHLSQAADKALTRSAYDARDAVRESLPKRFILRRPWVSQGIGVTPADPGSLTAHVWSRDRFMAMQEFGGTKTGKLAIPVGPMARLAKSQVIPKSLWPRQLLAKLNVFIRAGTLFERRGSKDIQALYLLRRWQTVTPRLGMTETVRREVLRQLPQRMQQALHELMASR